MLPAIRRLARLRMGGCQTANRTACWVAFVATRQVEADAFN